MTKRDRLATAAFLHMLGEAVKEGDVTAFEMSWAGTESSVRLATAGPEDHIPARFPVGVKKARQSEFPG